MRILKAWFEEEKNRKSVQRVRQQVGTTLAAAKIFDKKPLVLKKQANHRTLRLSHYHISSSHIIIQFSETTSLSFTAGVVGSSVAGTLFLTRQEITPFYEPENFKSMWPNNEGNSHVFQRRGRAKSEVEFDELLGDFSKKSSKRKANALKLLHRPTINYLKANTMALDDRISPSKCLGNQIAHESITPYSPIKGSKTNKKRREAVRAASKTRRGFLRNVGLKPIITPPP